MERHHYKNGCGDAPLAADPAAALAPAKIPPTLSLYLDLVRFMAAVSVVFYHSWSIFFPGSAIKWPGHEAVVVFFVLSGYVISHAAAQPGMTLARYAEHRAARILPVALLALLLSFVLAVFILPSNANDVALATLANALFVGQSGWGWMEAPMNPPYWSLNYEVWYYVVFGIWMLSAPRWRKPMTALAMLCAGPKILLLLPVWLMGVWLYRTVPTLSRGTAWCVFFVTGAVGTVLWWSDTSGTIRTWLYTIFPPAWRLHYSSQFIYDSLLGLVVTAHFAAVGSLGAAFGFLFRGEQAIRYLAGFTFSLYVFHEPIIKLLTKVAHVGSPLLFYCLIAVVVYALAQLTERRVKFFRTLLGRLGAGRRALPAPMAE